MIRALILISLLFGFTNAKACGYSSNEGELYRALEERKEMQRLVVELKEKSDAIFVASIYDEDEDEGYLVFEDIVNIKGETATNTKFFWEKPKEFEFLVG